MQDLADFQGGSTATLKICQSTTLLHPQLLEKVEIIPPFPKCQSTTLLHPQLLEKVEIIPPFPKCQSTTLLHPQPPFHAHAP
jgi:hypothetical protein